MSSTSPLDEKSIQKQMRQSLTDTIRILRSSSDGMSRLHRSHHLTGGQFPSLCDPKQFVELIFPGTNSTVFTSQQSISLNDRLPSSLYELLIWKECPEFSISSTITRAWKVLCGIHERGKRVGQILDSQAITILLPQIVQEAYSREIIDEMRIFQRRISSTLAKYVRPMANIDDERSQWEQLDENVIYKLLQWGWCVQDEFLGDEWLNLLRLDIKRYEKKSKLNNNDEKKITFSRLNRYGHVIPQGSWEEKQGNSIQTNIGGTHLMSWIELDDNLRETFPVLTEVIEKLHALPYEVNRMLDIREQEMKHQELVTSVVEEEEENLSTTDDGTGLDSICPQPLVTAGFRDQRFLVPGPGCTMLVKYPAGCFVMPRLDCHSGITNEEGGEVVDSGLRLTCTYHFRCDGEITESSIHVIDESIDSPTGAEVFFTPLPVRIAAAERRIPGLVQLVDDQLLLHSSASVLHSRTADPEDTWYALVFLVHGKRKSSLPMTDRTP